MARKNTSSLVCQTYFDYIVGAKFSLSYESTQLGREKGAQQVIIWFTREGRGGEGRGSAKIIKL